MQLGWAWWDMVAHACVPSTQEAEAVGSLLSLKTAWSSKKVSG